MSKEEILDKLKCFQIEDFKFDPVQHKYTYLNEDFISVTTFIQQFHTPFKKDYWSNKKAKERGITQEEILNEWKQLNDYANEVGSETHEWIEDYFNKKWRKLPTNKDIINRINKFNVIYAEQLYKLESVACEVRIFSKKWNIAGMVDSLFLYKGKLYILDWKTNKNFTTDENLKFKEKLLPPFDKYYKSHLSEYSIQLSLYSLILEENGIDIGGAYLVHIGPNDNPAKIYKVIDMRENLKTFLN